MENKTSEAEQARDHAMKQAEFWYNEAQSIERQRVIVFRALAVATEERDDLRTSINGYRVVTFALSFGYVVILLNTYVFGGAA